MQQVLKLNTNTLLGIKGIQLRMFSVSYSTYEMNAFLSEHSGHIVDIQFIKNSAYILYQEVDCNEKD